MQGRAWRAWNLCLAQAAGQERTTTSSWLEWGHIVRRRTCDKTHFIECGYMAFCGQRKRQSTFTTQRQEVETSQEIKYKINIRDPQSPTTSGRLLILFHVKTMSNGHLPLVNRNNHQRLLLMPVFHRLVSNAGKEAAHQNTCPLTGILKN